MPSLGCGSCLVWRSDDGGHTPLRTLVPIRRPRDAGREKELSPAHLDVQAPRRLASSAAPSTARGLETLTASPRPKCELDLHVEDDTGCHHVREAEIGSIVICREVFVGEDEGAGV